MNSAFLKLVLISSAKYALTVLLCDYVLNDSVLQRSKKLSVD